MKRTTVLSVNEPDTEKLSITIQQDIKGKFKDEATKRHDAVVDRVFAAMAVDFYSHCIKVK